MSSVLALTSDQTIFITMTVSCIVLCVFVRNLYHARNKVRWRNESMTGYIEAGTHPAKYVSARTRKALSKYKGKVISRADNNEGCRKNT